MKLFRNLGRLFLAVAGLGLCGLGTSCSDSEAQQGPQGFGPAAVTVAKPLVMPIVEWDRYTGRFRAVETVDVRSRVSGYLSSIHFTEGALVKSGDLLFVIDERPFQAQVELAEARKAEAAASLIQAQANLQQTKAELRNSKAQETLAQSRFDRANKAATTNAIAREQVDVRRSELSQAQAAVASATARVAAADAAIKTAGTAIETAEAAVKQAELDLSYCRIKSPISGRIGRHLVTAGNLVDGGSVSATLLATIVSIDPIHCYFDASEQAFLKYNRLAQEGKRQSSREVKNPAYASLVDEANYPHAGHMDFVDNAIDRGTGTMRARAIFRNPSGLLTPGLFATVQIPGSQRYDAVLVPDAAIGSDQAEKFVLVVNAENLVERVVVELGPINQGLRVIREGLKGDETIVISGLQRVRPGTPVNPTTKTIEPRSNNQGLPNTYEPVPREKWIMKKSDNAESGR